MLKPFTIDKGEDSNPFSSRTMDVVSYADARAEIERHEEKWQNYEQNYILPCFKWATEQGIDLHKLVRDNAGKNCIQLLVEALVAKGK